jgi:hydrogenase nickel incorporation protein HypB
MCEDCGCGAPDQHHLHDSAGGRVDATVRRRTASVTHMVTDLLAANRREAQHNRQHFDAHGVLAINLMSSPGAGKTALLEATIDRLGAEFAVAVIEGDLETENDANRIRAKGVPAIQINTGNACHLDAVMVHDALHHLDLSHLDVVFIENVGNLVCPAAFDLGQHFNVTLLSATEGDDKPAKYPVMFRGSDLVVLTKTDLLPFLDDFSAARAGAALKASGYAGPLVETTTRRPDGQSGWIEWLRQAVAEHRRRHHGTTSTGVDERVHAHAHPVPAAERLP